MTRFSFSSIAKIRNQGEKRSTRPNLNVVLLIYTGPFTVFVPVDQAFEILIQRFGGMEKASEEFNKNPDVLNSVSGCCCFFPLLLLLLLLSLPRINLSTASKNRITNQRKTNKRVSKCIQYVKMKRQIYVSCVSCGLIHWQIAYAEPRRVIKSPKVRDGPQVTATHIDIPNVVFWRLSKRESLSTRRKKKKEFYRFFFSSLSLFRVRRRKIYICM